MNRVGMFSFISVVVLGGAALASCAGDGNEPSPAATATSATASTNTSTESNAAPAETKAAGTQAQGARPPKPSSSSGAQPATEANANSGGAASSAGATQRQGSTTPVEKQAASTQTSTLRTVGARKVDQRDAVVFEFDRAAPGYRVEYTSSATACGSGQPVEIPGAAAILTVRLSPAAAHNSSGQATVNATSLNAAGDSIVGARQVCDSEGVVTWAIGLKSKIPFEVSAQGTLLTVTFAAAKPAN